ncbi:Rieske 2Fe-2S domain-containing protein [Streptomyces sp. NPDC001407]|uniref:Rieske 2Fe-2S domain-containing protein n=1 Tax=Streptomyces sp. NPDC001407 TaxID=3364573 RepID=UPI003679C2B1
MPRSRKDRSRTGPAAGYTTDAPLPYPDGWFCLGFSDELAPGEVMTRRLAGEDIVVYRTDKGTIHATRPYCPHLGAHLGLGQVRGEDIACAFHGFRFNGDGVCTRGYDSRTVPRMSIQPVPVCERNGAILVWRHHDNLSPQWDIPELPGLHPRPYHRYIDCIGHPQEIFENSADIGHVAVLHRSTITSVRLLEDPKDMGEAFHVPLQIRVRLPMVKAQKTFRYDVTTYGLGYSVTHITGPMGMDVQLLGHPTPQEPWQTRIYVGLSIRSPAPAWLPDRISRPLLPPLARLLSRVAMWVIFSQIVEGNTGSDIPVWASKKYLPHPRLAPGDGPIMRYRNWSAKFLPESPSCTLDRTSPGSERGNDPEG